MTHLRYGGFPLYLGMIQPGKKHLFIILCRLIIAFQPWKLVNKINKLFMTQEKTYGFLKYYYNLYSTEVIN